MIEKKDPHQKISPVDFDDDIIELTDEVITKPKDDDEIIDLQGTGTVIPKTPADIPLKTDKKEPESEEEDIIDLDGTPETESQAEGGAIDLDEGVSDYESTMGEDDIIASEIVASLGADDDDNAAALSDHAAPAAEQDEGIFDTEKEIELEYESDEDEYDFFALDDRSTLEELETITMDDEEPDDAVDDDILFDPVANLDLNSGEDDEIIAMDDDPQEGPDLMAFDDEETLAFGGGGDLPDLTDELEFEFDDEDDEDGIIEITEFDEHFPEEDEKKLERAGILEALDSDEDDFLELIEVEEDGLAGDEEVIEFNRPEEQIDEDEIDNFFSESLEDEPVFENEGIEPVEEKPALSTDLAMATVSPADEDEEFDFSIDSSEISMQVDRLDTFLSDDLTAEPEVASLPEKPLFEEETVDEDQPAVEDKAVPLPVTPDQIESIIEDAIKNKFGGKIENIICEVIEKAVSKEIDRLKTALLESTRPGDNE